MKKPWLIGGAAVGGIILAAGGYILLGSNGTMPAGTPAAMVVADPVIAPAPEPTTPGASPTPDHAYYERYQQTVDERQRHGDVVPTTDPVAAPRNDTDAMQQRSSGAAASNAVGSRPPIAGNHGQSAPGSNGGGSGADGSSAGGSGSGANGGGAVNNGTGNTDAGTTNQAGSDTGNATTGGGSGTDTGVYYPPTSAGSGTGGTSTTADPDWLEGGEPEPEPVTSQPSQPIGDNVPDNTLGSAAIINNFDNVTDSPTRWSFYGGTEFSGPGYAITGSVAVQNNGRGGQALTLQYQSACTPSSSKLAPYTCARYASANWSLQTRIPVPLSNPALVLMVRNDEKTRLSGIRVLDATNETIAYTASDINMSFEAPARSDWREYYVPMNNSTNHWGGDNDGQITNYIKEIHFIVTPWSTTVPTQGSISIDDIRLVQNFAPSAYLRQNRLAEATTAPSRALSAGLGVAGGNVNDDTISRAAEAGFTFLRKDFSWTDNEVMPNVYVIQKKYDDVVDAAAARGLGVMFIMDYGNARHGGAYPKTQADYNAYADFGQTAASHYKNRQVAFELWNEPNLTWSDTFFVPRQHYEGMLKAAIPRMKAAAPNLPITVGGMTMFLEDQFAYIKQLADANAHQDVEGFGVHPYRKVPETVLSDMYMLDNYIPGGSPTQWWNTEWGYSTYEDYTHAKLGNGATDAARSFQARMAARTLLANWLYGYPVKVWYSLKDRGTNPNEREDNFGLLDNAGNPKPSFYAVRTLTNAAKNRVKRGMIDQLPPGIHAVRMDGASDRVIVIWNTEPTYNVPVTFTASGLTAITDMLGQSLPMQIDGQNRASVTLNEAAGPVYLHYSGTCTPTTSGDCRKI